MENIRVALRSIRSNLLRSILTLMIIAVGITCLVGILTAIDTLLFSMNDSFNRIGANSFSIYPGSEALQSHGGGPQQKNADPINYRQAESFKSRYEDKGLGNVALSLFCSRNGTVSFGNEKTNPTVRVVGVDDDYIEVASYELNVGRNFTENETKGGAYLTIIGKEIVKMLFDDKDELALNQIVRIDNAKYKIIGVLKDKGSTFGSSGDRRVFIPLEVAKKYYLDSESNFEITAGVDLATQVDDNISASIGIMRLARKLEVGEENDFRIQKSDGILNRLKEMTSTIRLSTIAIAFMTLLGAAIGLMNIMLVSVTERTKEIGLRKAIGAPANSILFQFLVEAVVICLIGGILGIIFGIGLGNIVAILIKGKFILPLNWMILGIVTCVVVGVLSGIYPAYKASRLDPIEALRYE